MAIRLLSNETVDGTGAFTGNVSITSDSTPLLTITDTTNNVILLQGTDNANAFIRSYVGPLLLQTNGGTTALTLDSSQNATFAGQVLCNTNTTTPTSGDAVFYKASTGAVLSGYQAILETGSAGSRAVALTLDNSQNATFAGSVDVASTIYTGESLRFNGTGLNATDKKLYSPTDGELQWLTHDLAGAHAFSVSHQGTRRVYLNTSGDSYFTGGEVGIGTATPTNMLSIKGSSGSSKGLEIFHSNGNKVAELIHNGSGDEGMLKLLDSNSETVRIAGETNVDSYINSGNVGIGTATPSAKLEVNGDILVTGVYDTVYNDTSVAQQWYKFYEKTGAAGGDLLHFALLTVNNAEFMAEVKIFVPTYAGFSSGYGNLSNGQGAQVDIRMGGLNSQTNILEAIDEVANLGSTSTFLQLYLRIDPAYSNTEVRVINYPDATVHFSMSGSWSTTDPRSGLSTRSFPFYNGNTALNNTLNITSDNEVGIGVGTQNPSTALEVRNDDGLGSGLHLIADINRAGGTDAQLILGYFADGTNATGPVVYAANGFPLLFSAGSTEKMRLRANGDVHIVNGRLDLSDGTVYDSTINAGSTLYLNCDADNNSSGEKVIIGHGAYGTGSTPIAVFQENGRVGINTTNPLELLNVHQTTATAGLYMPISIAGSRYQADYAVGIAFRPENNSGAYAAKTAIVGSGGGYGYNQADLHFCLNQSATITDEVNLSDTRMIIKKSGYVGIGTSSPQSYNAHGRNLVVAGSGNVGITIDGASTSSGSICFADGTSSTASIAGKIEYDHGSDTMEFRTAAVTRMALNSSSLTVSGDVVAYGSPSDKRYKENIKPVTNALDKVSKLQGVTFDWKESESILDIKEDIGFIAQDVQEVLPELVRENEDGKLSLRDKGVVPVLVEAIKELKAEIEELKKSK